jgi:hypothetical protein
LSYNLEEFPGVITGGFDPMDEVEQCKTSGSFDCRAIIPEGIKQHIMSVGLMFVNGVLEHGFEEFVDNLNLPIGLRVLWERKLMGEA